MEIRCVLLKKEQQEQLTGGQTVPSQQVDSQKPENDNDDKNDSDNKERKDQSQGTTGGSSVAAATGSTSGSNSGSWRWIRRQHTTRFCGANPVRLP